MKVVKSLDIVNDYIKKLEQENKQLKVKSGVLEELIDYYIVNVKELEEKIDKAIELVEKGIDFKSIYFKRNENTEMWQILLIDDIKDRFLEILGDKE